MTRSGHGGRRWGLLVALALATGAGAPAAAQASELIGSGRPAVKAGAPDTPRPAPAPPRGALHAAAGDHDTAATAWQVSPNTGWTIGNGDATATGEPLAAGDPFGCRNDGGTVQEIDKTRWWRFTGTGGATTVTTIGSDITTIIAVYPASSPVTGALIGCRVTTPSGPYGLRFQTQPGVDYVVQIGGLTGGAAGTLGFTVLGSDDQAYAQPISLNSTDDVTNIGATVAAGESQACGAATLNATLWLRVHVPAQGTVGFSVATNPVGEDPIAVALRRGDGSLVAPCDTAVSGVGKTNAGVNAQVPPGDYFIQLGTPDDSWTFFHYTVTFAENLDVDGDTVQKAPAGKDCDDTNAAIRPGAPDVVNGRDDDCDGVTDPDRDGDGYNGVDVPGRQATDCNDGDRRIHPGVREVRGNRVDENCDRVKQPYAPLSSTTASWNADLTRYVVRRIPARATVTLRCRGRGCPRAFRKATKRYRSAKRSIRVRSRAPRVLFRPGARIELTVTARHRRGKRWRITIKARRVPAVKISNVGTGFR